MYKKIQKNSQEQCTVIEEKACFTKALIDSKKDDEAEIIKLAGKLAKKKWYESKQKLLDEIIYHAKDLNKDNEYTTIKIK